MTINRQIWQLCTKPHKPFCRIHGLGSFQLLFVFIDRLRINRLVLKVLSTRDASKDEQFYWHGIHKLHERWKKCVASNDHWLNYNSLHLPIKEQFFMIIKIGAQSISVVLVYKATLETPCSKFFGKRNECIGIA